MTQATLGVATVIYIDALDSKIFLVAHQASVLTLSGYYISKAGVQDLINGKYMNGASKILLGLGRGAIAACYAYNELKDLYVRDPQTYALTSEQTAFLTKQQSEIDFMYENQFSTGNWTELGAGMSKKVYVHSEFPNIVVKIPFYSEGGHWDKTENDAIRHYRFLKIAQKRVYDLDFQQIRIPKSFLMKSLHSDYLVEERFNLTIFIPETSQREAAESELNIFRTISDLCDVHLAQERNVGFLKGTEQFPLIGIIDFDCNKPNYYAKKNSF